MPPNKTTKALDDVLRHLRMSGTFYCHGQFQIPWGVSFPEMRDEGRFHLITAGSAVVYGEEIPAITLNEGDFILLPHGAGHNIVDRMGSPLMPYREISPNLITENFAQYRYGADGPSTRLICVSVRFNDPTAGRLLSLLPAAIHVKASTPDRASMEKVLGLIALEAKDSRAGGEAIITRLADILIVQAIRWWLERKPDVELGWLGALRDPQVGKVIRLIHRYPARPWTLTRLANEAGMSRSILASRFKELVGQSVMRYLTSWRMQLALSLLKQGRVDVGLLAERVGYHSESAFNRAFKRHIGQSPGSV